METWGTATIAVDYGVKVISVRSISDRSYEKLPRMENIFNSQSKVDISKSTKYFLNNPDKLYPFLKFKFYNMRKANNTLNSFLKILIPLINSMG